MIRLFKIWVYRVSLGMSQRMLADATPEERAVLCREIAVARLRLSQLEG